MKSSIHPAFVIPNPYAFGRVRDLLFVCPWPSREVNRASLTSSKSFPVNPFADPHPLNSVASILYKNSGGREPSRQFLPPEVGTCRRSSLPFSVYTSKFRIPQVLCLSLLRKLPGCVPTIPILELDLCARQLALNQLGWRGRSLFSALCPLRSVR